MGSRTISLGLLFISVFVLCAVGVSAQVFNINLSTPLNNTYTGGSLFLSANITDFANVTNVTWAFVALYGPVRVNYTFSNTTANLTFYGRAIDTTTIADGRYNITVNATNSTFARSNVSGNGSATYNGTSATGYSYWGAGMNITIDNTEPNVTLNFPAEGELLSAGGLGLNWTVTDALDRNLSTNITIDGVVGATGVASTNGTTSQYITFLDVGAHNWSITVIDEAGNVNTSITINFTIRAVSSGAGGTGSGGGAGMRTTRQALPADGLILTVFTTGRVSVEVDGTYQLLDLIRTKNNEEADITFGVTRATLSAGQSTSLDVDGDGAHDVTVTATNVYSKRTDLRIMPLGPAPPGRSTLPTHVVPRREVPRQVAATPTEETLAPRSDAIEESGEESGTSPEEVGGTGLEGVTGEVVGEAVGTGGFSVVMLIVSVLVLFAVVGLIYYLYRDH